MNVDSLIYFVCAIYFRDVYILPVEVVMILCFIKKCMLCQPIQCTMFCVLKDCGDPGFCQISLVCCSVLAYISKYEWMCCFFLSLIFLVVELLITPFVIA